MAAYKERIDRLNMLAKLIPAHLSKSDCPDPGRLLGSMAEQYDPLASESARRRAIQRDLEALVNYLNQAGPPAPNGEPWTGETFKKEMARLGA